MKKNVNRIITEELVEEYCNWLYSQEKSKETIQKYKYHISLFMDYMNGRGVIKKDVIMFKGILRRSMAPVTINGALAAINGFFKYRKWTDCIAKYYKISQQIFCSEDKEISRKEYIKLVKAANDSGNDRLSMLLQTICSTGIRISELPFITVEAVEKGKAEVDCKGRIRTVFLTKKLCTMLKEYTLSHNIKNGVIFVTRNGKPMDRSNIWREMKKISGAAGVSESKVFPHNLRHLFARQYYNQEKDLSRLADILGHSSVNTTKIYTMESGSNHIRQLEKLNLLLGFYNRMPVLL